MQNKSECKKYISLPKDSFHYMKLNNKKLQLQSKNNTEYNKSKVSMIEDGKRSYNQIPPKIVAIKDHQQNIKILPTIKDNMETSEKSHNSTGIQDNLQTIVQYKIEEHSNTTQKSITIPRVIEQEYKKDMIDKWIKNNPPINNEQSSIYFDRFKDNNSNIKIRQTQFNEVVKNNNFKQKKSNNNRQLWIKDNKLNINEYDHKIPINIKNNGQELAIQQEVQMNIEKNEPVIQQEVQVDIEKVEPFIQQGSKLNAKENNKNIVNKWVKIKPPIFQEQSNTYINRFRTDNPQTKISPNDFNEIIKNNGFDQEKINGRKLWIFKQKV